MNRNRQLLAVLGAGMLLAVGAVGVTALVVPDGGARLAPEEVVIRIDGVEVTFGELQMQREVGEVNAEVWRRLWHGEDFGMAEAFLRDTRRHAVVLAPVVDPEDEFGAAIASAAGRAALLAAAGELGAMSTDEESAAQAARHREFIEAAFSGEGRGFFRAQEEAVRAALGEDRYHAEYLVAQARESEARGRIIESLDVSMDNFEQVATAGLRMAQDARDVWLHPALGVSVEELQGLLGERIVLYERLGAADEGSSWR